MRTKRKHGRWRQLYEISEDLEEEEELDDEGEKKKTNIRYLK